MDNSAETLNRIATGIDKLVKASTMTPQERTQAMVEAREHETRTKTREADGSYQVRCRE